MITALVYLFDGLVLAVFSYRIFQMIRKTKNPFMFYFMGVTIFFSLNFIIYSIIIGIALALKDPKYLFWSDYFGRMMVYIGSLFAVQIPIYEISKKKIYRYLGASAVFILSLFLSVFNLFYPNTPYVDNLGIIHWESPAWLGIGLAIIILGIWIPTSFIFLNQFVQSKFKMYRSMLLGSGFIIGALGCALQDFGTNVPLYIFINFITAFGFLLIFLGVIYKTDDAKLTVRSKESPV